MQAAQTTLRKMIEGTHQYIVPLYQRAYSWEKRQWQDLWDDLTELCEIDAPSTHFLGSLVTMQTSSVPEGVSKYLLIDGQQRLTTIFVLLALLRDRARRDGEERLAEEIQNTLLVNTYKEGDDHFRLLPTQNDRSAFRAVIRGEAADPKSRISQAYRFFDARLGENVGVTGIKKAITESLSVVSILLESGDNPYLVFESLNAKGEPLTQADLIRNFFFLKIHSDQQDEMHRRYWQPMQDALPDRLAVGDRLTEFIRHYLMKEGEFVRRDSVYFTLKQGLSGGDVLNKLRDLSRSGSLYARLLDPSLEDDCELRTALDRLNRLDVTTAYPFLLHCYDEIQAGTLTPAGMAEIVGLLENFMVRRFVCNVPTNQLNKLFPPLYNQVKSGGYASLVEGVRLVLPGKAYPKDAEFRARLIDTKLYGAGDRRARTRFLLEAIERSFGHKEKVDLAPLNIEHVMPQTLSDSWRRALGEEGDTTYQLLLDTLGNLTLTGYNPELSNQDFVAKKGLLAQSHVQLNNYFAAVENWGELDIRQRGEVLADRVLTIWPYFGGDKPESDTDPVEKKWPKSVRLLGRHHRVNSWRDVLETTLEAIDVEDPDALERIAAAFPALLARDRSKFRNGSRELKNGMFVNVNLSGSQVHRWCERILEVADISPEDWEVQVG